MWLPALLVIAFAVVLVRTSWICDDAYITFRTVDNLVNGLGATWNAGERVQAYTHPLWMLLVSALRMVTGELFLTVHVLGIVLSTATAVIVARGPVDSERRRDALAACVALAVLLFSRGFVDYSTSGLENPLTHLLLAAFLVRFLGSREGGLLLLAFLAGLAVTNRMDAALLFAPALLARWWQERSLRGLGALVLGFAPFLAWEIFSIVYYGFPFPNTAYAKLGTGIPAGELAAGGLRYLGNSFSGDPGTLVAIAFGTALPLLPRVRSLGRRALPVSLGIALYLMYVVRIGGDFMSGRMLAAPLLAAVILIAVGLRRAPRWVGGAALLAVVALGFATPRATVLSTPDYGQDVSVVETGDGAGIIAERLYYYRATGLLSSRRTSDVPANTWALQGQEARRAGQKVMTRKTIGFFGYFAGPEVYVVDFHALSDPLLARIPEITRKRGGRWQPGHFRRELPPGYLATLRGNAEGLEDADLDRYFDELRVVVRGPLFTVERWQTIGRFLTRSNAELLNSYLATLD